MKRSSILSLLAVTALLCGTSAVAAPFDITTGDGNGADAYVSYQSGDAGARGGANATIIAWNNPPNWLYKLYLRFDVASLRKPIISAKLTITTDSGQFQTSPPCAIWGLNDGDPGESWIGSTIDWNNAPANDTTSGTNLLANATFLGVFGNVSAVPGGTGDFSGDALKNFLEADADGKATFIITSPGGYSDFASYEHATLAPPTLTIEETPGPPPFDITTADGNGADADVPVSGAQDGSYDNVVVWSGGGGIKGYMRFDLSSITRDLDLARLTVTTIDGQFWPGTTAWGLDDADPGESWGELTMVWNTAPANDTGSTTAFLGNATYLGDFANINNVAGGTGDLFGGALVNFLNTDTDGKATLMFASPNGFTYLASKENTTWPPPTLTVRESPESYTPTRLFITTADGSGADTWVQQTATGGNYGSLDNMIVWTGSGSYKGYVRFDLSAYKTDVEAARLILTTIDGQFWPGTTIWGLNDGDAGESWGELTTTWDNAPANDTGDATNFLGSATYLGVFGNINNVAGGTGDFSSDGLKDFLNADTDGQVTFMFASPNGFTYLAPKEHATLAPPTLFVRVGPVTAWGSIVLID